MINNIKLKDSQVVKLKAEHGFLSALARFNRCRLEKQKTKLLKETGKTLRKDTPERGFKTNKSDNNPLSADISVKNLEDFLGIDSQNVPTLLSTFKAAVTNKNAKKYTSVH